jgi:hypothetical protein
MAVPRTMEVRGGAARATKASKRREKTGCGANKCAPKEPRAPLVTMRAIQKMSAKEDGSEIPKVMRMLLKGDGAVHDMARVAGSAIPRATPELHEKAGARSRKKGGVTEELLRVNGGMRKTITSLVRAAIAPDRKRKNTEAHGTAGRGTKALTKSTSIVAAARAGDGEKTRTTTSASRPRRAALSRR